jgi:DNA repair exonuclease SbcCD ATPase subunit
LDNQIKNLENSMNDAEKEYGGERYNELKKDLQDFAQNLDAVEAAQQDVMEKTRESEQAYRQATQQKLGQNLDDLVKQSVKDLEDAERAMQKIAERDQRMASALDRAQNRANDTKNALEQRDFLEAREMARNAAQEAHDLNELMKNYARIDQMNGSPSKNSQEAQKAATEAQAKIAEVSKRLEKLFPDPKDVLSQKQMQALDDLRKRQQEIAGRTQKLGQQMKDINKKGPMFDQNAQADMESARGSMERAGQELGQKQAGRAVSSQGAALEQMRKMKDAMKKQGQGQGSGMPMPIGGTPNPFGDGNDPRNQDKVEIPNGDQFKVPPEFRRDILDAMKQGTPQKFKQQVDEFYKELIK